MEWTLPGTLVKENTEDAPYVERRFAAMFMGGGIMLSQISAITGLEPYDVQNWVKRGFLPPPQRKRYDVNQLCRILNINMLKNVLTIEQICGLLGYINGELDDENDDLIDDSRLYFMFVTLAARYRTMHNVSGRDEALEAVLEGYEERRPGAKDRIRKVLRVMLTAWASNQLRISAIDILDHLEEKG